MLETIILASFILLGTLSIAAWTFLIKRHQRGYELLPVRQRDASPIGLADVALMFFSWIAGQLVVATVIGKALGVDLTDPTSWSSSQQATIIIAVGLSQLLATLACLGVYRHRYGTATSFGLQNQWLGKDIKIGLIAFVFIIPPVQLIQLTSSQFVPYEHDTLETLKESSSGLTVLATWFGAVLVAPIVEEIFFRGMLQNWLARLGNNSPERFNQNMFGGWYTNSALTGIGKENDAISEVDGIFSDGSQGSGFVEVGQSTEAMNEVIKSDLGIEQVKFDSKLRWLPIFLSAGLFAGAHVGQGVAWIPLFFLGLGLGFLFRQTQSIVPCIIVHFMLNFYSMFWATMAMQFAQ